MAETEKLETALSVAPSSSDGSSLSSDAAGSAKGSSKGFRYLVLFVTTLCLTSICSNMSTIYVTMICVDRDNSTSSPLTDEEKTKQNAILLWSISIGSILLTFPFNWLYGRYGARWVFFWSGVISIASTAAVPIATHVSIVANVAARFLQGVGLASTFAAIGMVCSRWAALDENGFFLSAMTIYSQVSVVITNPLSGYLCQSSWGWPSVYYVHAAAGPFFFGLWIWLYTDYPETHKCVSEAESTKILKGKAEKRKLDGYLPLRKIITNKVILVVWFNAFGDIISAIFLLTYLPTYLKSVLGYSVPMAALLSILPPASHIPAKLLFGWIFDKTRCMSEINKMRVCNTIALKGSALLFIVVGFIPNDSAGWSVAVNTLNYAFIGANCGGFYKCGTLVSRQYSHFVVSNIQFLKCISLFISPLLVYLFVHDSTDRDQWRIIYIIMAAFLIVGNFLFLYYVTDQPADFTKLSKSVKELKKDDGHLQESGLENSALASASSTS